MVLYSEGNIKFMSSVLFGLEEYVFKDPSFKTILLFTVWFFFLTKASMHCSLT